jgi:hypothetical protein
MSHSDNTQRKFDTNFPDWLSMKLVADEDTQSVGISRQASKRQWIREMELELTETF